MSDLSPFRLTCTIVSALSVVAGAVGMAFSFLVLSSASTKDIIAGSSGFIAGSVLVASGMVSLTLLATAPPREPHRAQPIREQREETMA